MPQTLTQPESAVDALDALNNAAKYTADCAVAAEKIAQAKIDLVIGRDAKAVFFATIIMRLRFEATAAIDTMATDGRRILYNPAFVVALPRKQVLGVLAHEAMHITNAHHARQGDRDARKWNIAGDLAINAPLVAAGFELPPDGLFPGKGRFSNMKPMLCAEEYYSLLPNDKGGGEGAEGGEGEGNDPGRCGGVIPPGKGTPAECRQAEAEARELVAAADQAVKASGRGTLPSGISRDVDGALEPKVDWRDVLREFVSRNARNDFSWSRPNRRYIHAGIYLPGMLSEELGDVVLAVDQSGSIGDDQLAEFAAEAQAVLDNYDCTLTILYHDTDIHEEVVWRSDEGPLKLKRVCTGGTDHHCIFERIERGGESPACLICLTDLCTSFPETAPEYPVLWCDPRQDVDAMTPPFGRVVGITRTNGRL